VRRTAFPYRPLRVGQSWEIKMHAVRWTMLGAAALALAGCGSKTETNTTDTVVTTGNTDSGTMAGPNASMAATASVGQSFANAAAASDAFEIASSRLAATQASAAPVKKFAESMIKAHTDSTAKLKTAAAASSPAITPDPTLTSAQQQKLDALKALNGATFDSAYAAAQVEAHQQTLDALKTNAANQEVPQPLRDFASKLVPTVTAHLNMAKGLAR
jgi:putative membrane protein